MDMETSKSTTQWKGLVMPHHELPGARKAASSSNLEIYIHSVSDEKHLYF
jgi:hypothetical protein